MSRKKKRGRKSRANRGSFRPGPDPRRHVFSTSDCRIGYWVVMLTKDQSIKDWLRKKVSIHFSRKANRGTTPVSQGESNGSQEKPGRAADGICRSESAGSGEPLGSPDDITF